MHLLFHCKVWVLHLRNKLSFISFKSASFTGLSKINFYILLCMCRLNSSSMRAWFGHLRLLFYSLACFFLLWLLKCQSHWWIHFCCWNSVGSGIAFTCRSWGPRFESWREQEKNGFCWVLVLWTRQKITTKGGKLL